MNVPSRPPALPTEFDSQLHELVRTGDIQRLAVALNAGADPDLRDRWGMTPLLAAVQHGRSGLIWVLGKAGADPDAVDANGETVMDLARRRRDALAISALREARLRCENPLACPSGIASNAVARASNRAARPDRAMERGKERKDAT